MVSVLFWILDFLPQYSLSCTFVTLCSALSLYRPLHICVCVCVCVCVGVRMPFPALCLCVCLCVCVWLPGWLTDWLCVSSRVKCQSHFTFITWGTKRRALLCNLSLPVAAAQPPRRTWEHTRRTYMEAFKHLILRLFHYNRKAFFCFSRAHTCCARRCEATGEGWQMAWLKASRKERLIDWLIVMDWPVGVWIRIMNTFVHRGGCSKHNFSRQRPFVQNTCQELAMREIMALRVMLVDMPEWSTFKCCRVCVCVCVCVCV